MSSKWNIDLSELLEKAQEFDVNDLQLENVGSWPAAARVFVWLFIAAVIGASGYFIMIKPEMEQLDRMVAEEVQLKKTFERRAREAANLDVYRTQLETIKSSFSALLSQLPTDTEIPGLIDDISETGLNAGLSFQTINLQSERATEFYVELPINIEVTGGFHDFGTFVSGVAGLSRIVTLHNFSVSTAKDGDLKMNIMAKTYRYKEDEE